MRNAKCDNCSRVWSEDQLKDVVHMFERVDPDASQPLGECPECGCLAYEEEPDYKAFAEFVARSVTTTKGKFSEVPTLLWLVQACKQFGIAPAALGRMRK